MPACDSKQTLVPARTENIREYRDARKLLVDVVNLKHLGHPSKRSVGQLVHDPVSTACMIIVEGHGLALFTCI